MPPLATPGVGLYRHGSTGWNQYVSTPLTAAPVAAHPYITAATWNWNKLPTSPVLDTNSAAIVANLSKTGTSNAQRGLGVYDFSVPVVGPDSTVTGTTRLPITSSTPRYTVTFTQSASYGNPPSPFGTDTVPIPTGTKLATGSDCHLTIIDPVNGYIYSMWQASYNSSTDKWSCSWGARVPIQGDGRESGVYSSTASQLTRPAGIIRLSEIVAGVIPHALFFSSDMCTPSTYRYPAGKTDGDNTAGLSPTIDQGTRVFMDPTINIAAISGITQMEVMVGVALQQYGAYCGDKGGSRMAFICEKDPNGTSGSAPGSVYTNVGITYDYFDMTHLPWATGLRVMKNWDGS